MRCVEKSKDGPTVRSDFFVNNPAFVVISIAFVVWLTRLLVERVGDAFVENLFGVFRP